MVSYDLFGFIRKISLRHLEYQRMKSMRMVNKQYLLKAFQLLRNNGGSSFTGSIKIVGDMLIYDYLIGNTDNHIKKSFCYCIPKI